eukprot:COSAG01_NODE_770_length_13726_cov_66.211639_12_plen_37_part_00
MYSRKGLLSEKREVNAVNEAAGDASVDLLIILALLA